MALSQPHLFLIAYDIREPRRLGRIHRFLRKEGLPVQYSVFTARLTERKLQRVMAGLERMFDPRVDDGRIDPLLARQEQVALGLQMFPDDVMLLADGINLMVR